MKQIVNIADLTVIRGKSTKALDDVNLSLQSGKITGVIGPSGAGKTTLLRVIAGRLRSTTGHVTVFDLPVTSPELRNLVSYMTQDVSVYQDLTVTQNLRYFTSLYKGTINADNQLIKNVLADVDLSDKAHALVKNLSGGQKQRVSLAVTLLGPHQLIILDEPTTGLDPVLRAKLWKLFKKLRDAGSTILISSHAMDEAQKCDDLILIRDGSIIAHDKPLKLMKSTKTDTIEDSFLKLVERAA